MSNSHLAALGLAVDTSVSRKNDAIAPGTERFTLTTEAPDQSADTVPAGGSVDTPGPLVGTQTVVSADASGTKTLADGFDKLSESARARYSSIFASYFPG
ncbi:MAG: hypothetical protein JJU21_13695 [Salinarimonas sp.]|nr:hypothetical protein [Salinarimonas sp.]